MIFFTYGLMDPKCNGLVSFFFIICLNLMVKC